MSNAKIFPARRQAARARHHRRAADSRVISMHHHNAEAPPFGAAGEERRASNLPAQSSATEKKVKQRAHFAWQEMAAARTDIKPVFKLVAWALALYENVENGRCDPSYLGLAKRAGVSESTAKRAIACF